MGRGCGAQPQKDAPGTVFGSASTVGILNTGCLLGLRHRNRVKRMLGRICYFGKEMQLAFRFLVLLPTLHRAQPPSV